ncbi:hypothetical protein ACFFIX_12390 [Metabacillus herbersteinensis]|uniref:Polysaccharide chain length determinant N-terminal domain-containing protein n=1 Tax=Metabacillus herbersteinensis TaxID=283816 RepID=A0ABV6GF78_9BACI
MKERFVFYDYLHFLWIKKLWLLPLPAIMIIVALVFNSLSEPSYNGQSTFYTGGVEKDSLGKPHLVQAVLLKDIETDQNFNVTAVPNLITLHVNGLDKQKVNDVLGKFTDAYNKKIIKAANEELKSIEVQLRTLKEVAKVKENTMEFAKDWGSEKDESVELALYLISKEEEESLENAAEIEVLEKELSNYEEPQLLTTSVLEKDTYVKSNLIIAFIAGVFLSFVLLTLWKYILDARRYKQND